MKNSRHLFILIGFLAQSLTWDTFGFAAIVSFLWVLCVTRWHHRFELRLTSEAIALLLGCAVSVGVSHALNRSAHFFIGDGLIALQLVRLVRPLNRREKLTSVVVACFHLGVLCTLAPNLRFVALFLAGLYLLPGALKDAFYDRDETPHTRRSSRPCAIQFVPTMRVCLWLLLGSVFVFVTFPRFTGSPLQLRDGLEQGSLLETILDPRRGGRANSQQTLLQVEGIDVGYMRCFALTEFDGVKWWKDTTERVRKLDWSYARKDLGDARRFLPRKVYVKNAHYLGRFIPLDGAPLYMEQTFFTHPIRNVSKGSDTYETTAVWTASENTYEYFIDTRARPEPLDPAVRQHLLECPPQSERLTNWLAAVTAGATNRLQKARSLEAYLRTNFTYQIGTPELTRLAAIDEFIFERKQGHCERFAASMALLLRLQGIPSRIAIGYVPTRKNMFSGRMQVRFSDAHSWTEGYIDGLGWQSFDATPGPPPGTSSSDFFDMLDEVEFAWYSHVVNFNGFAQRDLAAAATRGLEQIPANVWTAGAALCVLVILFGTASKMHVKLPRLGRFGWKRKQNVADAAARHYYEEMVQVLRRHGFDKPEAQTPFEFLDHLRASTGPRYSDAELITESFCSSFYGAKRLSAEQEQRTLVALNRLKQNATPHGAKGN